MKSRKRLMELAGISVDKSKKALKEDAPGTEGYFGMEDEVQWYDTVEGFTSLITQADESDEEVETLDSINRRSDDLYPGKKYYGMYAGESMGENIEESIRYIDKLDDKDFINLPNLL